MVIPATLQPPQRVPSPTPATTGTTRTVFCDFDGPIVNVSARYYSTYRLALAETQTLLEQQGSDIRFCPLSADQFWQMKQERVPDVEIAMRSGLSLSQTELFLQRVNYLVNQPALLHQDSLQEGVAHALLQLRDRGLRVVLVTLRCQEQVTELLESYELSDIFDGIYGTQDCQIAYQNQAELKTQLLREAIATETHLGHSPLCMIGDTEADILAGQQVGIPTLALTCGIRSDRYLRTFNPTYIHSDLVTAVQQLLGCPKLF